MSWHRKNAQHSDQGRHTGATSMWESPVWSATGAKGWRWLLLPVAAFALTGVLALAIDVPLTHRAIEVTKASQTTEHKTLVTKAATAFRELLEMSETFGHGVGVAMLALAVYALDPRRRWAVPRLLIVTYGAGLAANLGKMVVARTRPTGFDLLTGDVWQTFEGWFRFGAGGSLHQGFPSAHTATAVAFALLLACLYPHARWLFIALAVLVATQRLQCGAHFLSDICGGAAAGWLFTVGSFRGTPFTRLMDRFEARWAGNAGAPGQVVAAPGQAVRHKAA